MPSSTRSSKLEKEKLAEKAKAAFLAMDPNKVEDPLAYRVLLVLPVLYRKWATAQLNALEERVRSG